MLPMFQNFSDPGAGFGGQVAGIWRAVCGHEQACVHSHCVYSLGWLIPAANERQRPEEAQ